MAGSQVPIDVPLTNISVAAFQNAEGFIADKVFPVVPVDLQSGVYYKFDEDELNRDTAQVRADASESAGDSYEIGKDRYQADVWALHRDVGDQLQANYKDVPGTPLNSAARFIVGKMRLRQERQFAADFLKAGVWGTDYAGIASGTPAAGQFLRFDNEASDPIEMVEQWKADISDKTGLEPNVLALGKRVWSKLKNHPAIIERFKYTTSENMSLEIIAALFELEKVIVSRAMVNTAKRGKGITNERVFDKGALLVHAAAAPGIEVPSAGYIFNWTGVSDGLGESIGTRQFRLEHLGADRVESQIAFDNKVVAKSLGLFAADVVS